MASHYQPVVPWGRSFERRDLRFLPPLGGCYINCGIASPRGLLSNKMEDSITYRGVRYHFVI
jgi:hypothetical protein